MSLINRATFVFWMFFLPAGLGAEIADVRIDIIPPIDQVRPLSNPARIVLAVSDSDGNPVSDGRFKVRLQAPPPGWLWSTDFPVVEGTQLIEMILPVSGGRAEWKYLFPIRGRYRLAVAYLDETGGSHDKIFLVAVKENRKKFVYLGLFAGILFCFGFTAGRIFTQRIEPRRSGGATHVLIAGLLCGVCASDTAGYAAEPENSPHRAQLEIFPATVGRPSRMLWHLRDSRTGQAIPGHLSLTVEHVEKGKRVFSLERVSTSGEFSLDFQFTDGSDYEVTVRQDLEDGGFVERRQSVAVTPVEPPTSSILRAVFLFLAVLALGLIVGRWSRVGLTRQIRN